jgi:hypothetical membrane protein
MTRRPRTPFWGLISSAAAPVLLIGGWTVAAGRQRPAFDSVAGTISDLAAHHADDRWLMTTALAGLGICHVVTAVALRDAATAGRVVLAAGGVATLLVAATPLPADGAGSLPHTVAAGSAFVALAAWPAVAHRPGSPWALRRGPATAAAAALLGLLGWFAVEYVADGGRIGLAERWAAGAEALWPMAVAWSSRFSGR